MKYTKLKAILNDSKELKKFPITLKSVPRNQTLNMLQDYYDGNQWLLYGYQTSTLNTFLVNSETRYTRSEKEMWKPFDPKNKSKGFKEGELKTYNLSRSAIEITAKYSRGDSDDDVKVTVKRGDDPDDELTEKSNKIFDNLNEFVIDGVRDMSINSVIFTEYVENNEIEDSIYKTMYLKSEDSYGYVKQVDPREMEPLYWHGQVRGYLRFYSIDKYEAQKYGVNIPKKDEAMYWELSHVTDNGSVEILKFIEDVLVDSKISENDYLPYTMQVNEKHNISKFDFEHIEVSDMGNLVDLQDDINAYLTDLGNVIRKVAMPYLKLTDKFVQEAMDQDFDKVRRNLSALSTAAGTLLSAPVERLSGDTGIPNEYLQDLLQQFYITTGIPKSIFNSEGLGQLAEGTLDKMIQSLRVKVGDKRSRMTEIIKTNVKKCLISQGESIEDIEIEVHYPNMVPTDATQRINTLIQGYTSNILPKDYSLENLLDYMGDSEDAERIIAEVQQDDAELTSLLQKRSLDTRQNLANNRAANEAVDNTRLIRENDSQ